MGSTATQPSVTGGQGECAGDNSGSSGQGGIERHTERLEPAVVGFRFARSNHRTSMRGDE